jgi:hypothetical protein
MLGCALVALIWLANSSLAQAPSGAFTKITEGDIVNDPGSWHGCGWADFDGDGALDLFVASVGGRSALYRNNGNGTFTKATNSGLGENPASSTAGIWGDFDNDGRPDLFVLNSGSDPWLYRNNGNGTFSLVEGTGIERAPGDAYGAAWADYDNDGKLDLLIANAWHPSVLYHNNGNGTFTKMTGTGLSTENAPSITCAWGDYDNDGFIDLFIANGGQSSYLYHNNGNGTFTQVASGAIATDSGASVACAWGDYDNDGYLDLFVANRLGNNWLYHNNGNGTFTKVTAGSIVNDGGDSNGCAWADYDNDGWLDLYVGNWQGENNFLYHNNGDGTFTRITEGSAVNDGASSVGIAWGDFNHDGFLDLFVSDFGGKNLLFQNDGNGNKWLKVKCVGTISNRGGMGARVRVKTTAGGIARWQTRQITGGGAWGSESLFAQFGLGDATQVDTVQVEWPSGVMQELHAVAAGQTLTVTEAEPLLTVQPQGGTFTDSLQVTLSTGIEGGEIHYSLDGGQPTPASTLYTNPFTLEASATLLARVFVNGAPASELRKAAFRKALAAPTITGQPQSQTVGVGANARFTVSAGGSPPLAYQWQFNGADVPGATQAELAVTSVKPEQAGTYRVRVTNPAGEKLSAEAILVVNVPGVLTKVATGPVVQDSGSWVAGSWGDYDGDGNLDLFVTSYSGNNRLYRNKGNGTFEAVTSGVVIGGGMVSHGSAWADYDNDGRLDLLVANRLGQNNFLFHGIGDGTFTKVTTGSVVNDSGDSIACAWADYDRDGFLDLFVANLTGKNFLYHNNGNGTFTKITSGDIVNDVGNSVTCAWGDYDNDGYPDLFAANGGPNNFLYRNNGNGTFTKITSGSIVNDGGYSAGCAWGDYDNDGNLDLFVANRAGPNFLYHNNGDGTFTRITQGEIVSNVGDSNGCIWGDYDNDGFLDLCVARLSGPNLLYHNNGDGTFTRITTGAAVTDVGDAIGVAWGDYNNDGFLDLFVANWRAPRNFLYQGVPNGNNWIKVKCIGTISNRSAIGARLLIKTVTDGVARWQVREIGAGDSWGTQSLDAHIGLGGVSTVDTLRVQWPSGAVQELQGVAGQQLVTLIETPQPLTIQPYSGSFDHSIDVSIVTAVPNGTINLTLDGSEPTATSPTYAGTFKLSSTTTVKARVFDNGTAASDIVTANYSIVLTAPKITSQPLAQTVLEGATAAFGISATGTTPLSYQWTFNGQEVPDATNRTLTLPKVSLSQAGDYAVKVINEVGTAASDTVKLTVNPRPVAPAITKQPTSQTAPLGGTATFTVEATGTAPLSYEWRRNGLLIAGANKPTFIIATVQRTDAALYSVRVRNVAGSAVSTPVSLTVIDKPVAPTITSAPASQVVNAGTDVSLTVTATGSLPLSYEWRLNGATIAGANDATLLLPAVQAGSQGTYTVTVSNSGGSASTDGAVLAVFSGEAGGTVNFNNAFGAIDAPVFDSDGTTRLAGPGYLAQLYAGPSAEALAPIGPAVPFRIGPAAGYVNVGTHGTRIIASVTAGEVAAVQVRAWDSSRGPSYEQALKTAGKIGQSAVLMITTGGAGTPPGFPANLDGLQSFSIARETVPPVITITSPMAGATADERISLSGTATDNAGVQTARWELDGSAVAALTLDAAGHFSVPGLRLHRGDNHFRVIAIDVAGNEAAAEVVVTWAASRTLAVLGAADQQEGRRVALPLQLVSQGDVGGLTFLIKYDAQWFTDPDLAWEADIGSASVQVNYDMPGQIRATLSLPATTIPAGTNLLAEVSLRARSVPGPTETTVGVTVLDVADSVGNQIVFGTDVAGGGARILPRRFVGDVNGNDRLDIGDATLIQRLVVALDPVRPWDVAGNDLNQSAAVDSGDVIKVLRAVVGLDPQPQVGPVAPGPRAPRPGLQGADSTPAGLLSLDRPTVAPGDLVTIVVNLRNVGAKISGAAFTLSYPAAALELASANALHAGAIVPANAISIWNTAAGGAAAGQVAAAMSSPTPWAGANGALATLTFRVLPGAGRQAAWGVGLSRLEITSENGYEVAQLPAAPVNLQVLAPVQTQDVRWDKEGLHLSFAGAVGAQYVIEASADLVHWDAVQTLSTTTGMVEFVDPAAATLSARFYRIITR